VQYKINAALAGGLVIGFWKWQFIKTLNTSGGQGDEKK